MTSYGCMTPEMETALTEHVRGKTVWDLGAGGLGYSHLLLRLGAKQVLAFDKIHMVSKDARIECQEGYFHEIKVTSSVDVAFLAWPQNATLPGLLPILAASQKVVYLGSNVGGSACGNEHLFNHFLGRQALSHIPNRQNTFAVYGGPTEQPRRALPEEWAGLHPDLFFLSFEEAERAVR